MTTATGLRTSSLILSHPRNPEAYLSSIALNVVVISHGMTLSTLYFPSPSHHETLNFDLRPIFRPLPSSFFQPLG